MPNISTATAAPAPAAVDRRRGPRPAAAAPPALRDAPGGAPAATPGSSRLRQHPVRGGRQCASTEQHTPGPFRPEHTHGEDHPHARNRYSRRRTRYRTAPRGLTSCSARRWQENAHGGQSAKRKRSPLLAPLSRSNLEARRRRGGSTTAVACRPLFPLAAAATCTCPSDSCTAACRQHR